MGIIAGKPCIFTCPQLEYCTIADQSTWSNPAKIHVTLVPQVHEKLSTEVLYYCPECNVHHIVPWPSDQDAHTADRYAGLCEEDLANRKAEFKDKYMT